ncbi:MAG: superoxide dismutase [Bacteroidales bacterium]|jgi:Fe-Mn family superoxide dismutase|nr:superoxide dismutase [Bacteroidales bacterium]
MFTLPELPWAKDALAPIISSETIDYHYGKHHQTYVNNLNNLISGTEFENATLEEIILNAKGGIFNNAAQVWNHTFYWESMMPNAPQKPGGELLAKIEAQYGSFEEFKKQFAQAATTLFGSGWAWLVINKVGKLEIIQTGNAENPMTQGLKPILTCDVWEHAYYVDYRNKRVDYIEKFFSIVDWGKVEERC